MDVETLTQLGTYIDSRIKGADVDNGTAGLEAGEVDKFAAEKNQQNGLADIGAKELNDHKNRLVEEQNHNLKNAVTGNGSNSHLSSEKKSGNGSTRKETEIQEDEQLKPGESSNFIVAELDVERVLEEQETHDLYCPNCLSCITKRVILRKRKRTRGESQSDLPPQKVHVPEASPAPPTETADHEDETVFRCLSCFSFFIPTETGFNIFWIFGKRTPSDKLQSSEKKPALFGSGSSQNEGTEARVPLPETDTSSSRDPSLDMKEKSPPISTPGATNLGEQGTTIGTNNAGPSSEASYSNGELIGNQAQAGEQKNPSTTVSEDPSAGESYPNGGLLGNKSPGDKPSYPATAVSEEKGTDKPGIMVKPPFPDGRSQIIGSINSSIPPAASYVAPDAGNNINKLGSMVKPTSPIETTGNQNIHVPEIPSTIIDMGVQGIEESASEHDWDVLKSIVYGGLIESITSLSVVSSAAGSGSSTLNICALGLANLIGGLFVIAHDISELRSAHDAESTNRREEQGGRYWEKLGKRQHFRRHAVFAILSYIIFGLLPPVIYGFAFRKSDNREYKVIAVAASSLLCIALLAIGKGHVRPQKDHIKSLFYYLAIAVPASGVSYVAGVMIDRLLVELGLFDPNAASPPSPPSSIELFRFGSGASSFAF